MFTSPCDTISLTYQHYPFKSKMSSSWVWLIKSGALTRQNKHLRVDNLKRLWNYSGIICSLSTSSPVDVWGCFGADPGACFFLIPLTISSILKSMQAASIAVLNVCSFTPYESQTCSIKSPQFSFTFQHMYLHSFYSPLYSFSLLQNHKHTLQKHKLKRNILSFWP